MSTLYTYYYIYGQRLDRDIITDAYNVILDYEEKNETKVTKFCYKVDSSNNLWETDGNYPNIVAKSIYAGRRLTSGFFAFFRLNGMQSVVVDDDLFYEIYENVDLTIYENRFIFDGDMVYIYL